MSEGTIKPAAWLNCVDCQRYQATDGNRKHRCTHWKDIVTGQPADCYEMRAGGRGLGFCGPDAGGFKQREESIGAWASRTVKDGVGAEELEPAATSFRPKQPCTESGCGGTMSLRRYEGRLRWFCDRGGLIGMGGAENEGQHDGAEELRQWPRCDGAVGQDEDDESLYCAEPGNCWWGWRPDTPS